MIPTTALDAVREHLAKTVDRLALPCAHLVRMNLVLRGDLLKRPVATKRLQRNPRLQLPENLRLLLIAYPSSVGGIHLNQLYDFMGPPHKAFQVLLRVFCRDDQTFSLIGGALPFEQRDVGMLDLLSATDICAGALAEYLTQRELLDADRIAVKPGCEHVLQWLAHDGIGLKKMNIIMRRGADASIESAAIEFVLDNPPKDVTIVPISM